ncbi:MAG TPA: hypothetical protein PLO67_21360 [Saprospiraceae bacterium]|jgi:hypothetical protein|nr:hypothetical protein [Saprospiraceae bacterium]HPI08543.1 hypothetical protein [Saprospiraceae bacterium]
MVVTEKEFRTRIGNLLLYSTAGLVTLVVLMTVSGGLVREQILDLLLLLAAFKGPYILALVKFNTAHKKIGPEDDQPSPIIKSPYVRLFYGIMLMENAAIALVLLATWAGADWITFEALTSRWLPGIETLFGVYLGLLLPDLFRTEA